MNILSDPLFNNDYLITEQGQIDRDYIERASRVRALFRYGPDYTDLDIAWWRETLTNMAILLQAKFRDGLFVPPRRNQKAA